MRSAMSGMMLMRAIRLNLRGWTTSAVPSQLLPTYRTSRVFGAFLRTAPAAAAGTATTLSAAISARAPLPRIVPDAYPLERFANRATASSASAVWASSA